MEIRADLETVRISFEGQNAGTHLRRPGRGQRRSPTFAIRGILTGRSARGAGFPARNSLENFSLDHQPWLKRETIAHLATALGLRVTQLGHRVPSTTRKSSPSKALGTGSGTTRSNRCPRQDPKTRQKSSVNVAQFSPHETAQLSTSADRVADVTGRAGTARPETVLIPRGSAGPWPSGRKTERRFS